MTRKVSSRRSFAEPDGPGGTGRRLLDRVVDVHAQAAAVPEMVADEPRQEGQGHDHFVDAMPLDQLEDVLDAGLVDDRHHRLGLVGGQRAQTGALTARHDDCLHESLLVADGRHPDTTRIVAGNSGGRNGRARKVEESGRPDLNRRPSGPQPDALPSYATSRRGTQYSAPSRSGLPTTERGLLRRHYLAVASESVRVVSCASLPRPRISPVCLFQGNLTRGSWRFQSRRKLPRWAQSTTADMTQQPTMYGRGW